MITLDDWYILVSKQQHLAIRTTEAASRGRASAFNKSNIDRFFDNLAYIQDQYSFTPQQMYNLGNGLHHSPNTRCSSD